VDTDDLDEVVQTLVEAMDAGDVETVLAMCADDVVFIGSGEGEQAIGRPAVAAMFEVIAELAADSDFRTAFPHIDVEVFGGVALATAFGTATMLDDDGAHNTGYRMTAVFIDVEGEWLLASYHGSEPAPW
jgi:uncharacterized protein (TIGR02246 family)